MSPSITVVLWGVGNCTIRAIIPKITIAITSRMTVDWCFSSIENELKKQVISRGFVHFCSNEVRFHSLFDRSSARKGPDHRFGCWYVSSLHRVPYRCCGEVLHACMLFKSDIMQWCHHCKRLEPIYEAVAEALTKRYPQVVFAQVDVNDNPRIGRLEKLSGVPIIRYFKSGKPLPYEGRMDKQ